MGRQGEPIAEKNLLGWAAKGPIVGRASSPAGIADSQGTVSVHFLMAEEEHRLAHRFFNGEALGTEVKPQPLWSNEDQVVLGHLEKNIQKLDGQPGYMVKLPWRPQVEQLGSNLPQAEQRWMRLRQRLSRDSRFKEHYEGAIQRILTEGFAQWRWLPGTENVADEATRSLLVGDGPYLTPRWRHGPSFLLEPEDKWPADLECKLNAEEIKPKWEYSTFPIQVKYPPPVFQFDFGTYRSWRWVFSRLARWRRLSKLPARDLDRQETVLDVSVGESWLLRQCQLESYFEDMSMLKERRGKEMRKNQKLKNISIGPLHPYLDENGLHESLVKSAKRALQAVLQDKGLRRTLTETEFRVVISEVMGFLNERPLCYVSSDPKDESLLTPNSFLLQRPNKELPP
ncbi:hypothetical protein TCAL_06666, partial [Tigriopus californicus]